MEHIEINKKKSAEQQVVSYHNLLGVYQKPNQVCTELSLTEA